jgi:hypothetical protein
MCDYSLHGVKSRPAKVGDRLTTRHFNTGTRGFAAPEDASTAVCVVPGTELAFANTVRCSPRGLFAWKAITVAHTTAIFRQVNKDNPRTHHERAVDRSSCRPRNRRRILRAPSRKEPQRRPSRSPISMKGFACQLLADLKQSAQRLAPAPRFVRMARAADAERNGLVSE